MTKQALNKLWFGILLGIVGPIIGAIIYYFLQEADKGWAAFIDKLFIPTYLSAILSVGALLNAGIFFLLLNTELDKAARGIIFALLLYGALVVYLKFIL